MVDFGFASRGIGLGIGMIGIGIGLEHLSNSVKNIEKPRKHKNQSYTPSFGGKHDLYKQYSFKPIRWKI